MQIPAAGFIEAAQGILLKQLGDDKAVFWLQDELKELHAANSAEVQQRMENASMAKKLINGPSWNQDDFYHGMCIGYLLALEAARAVVASSPALLLAKVKPGDLL